MIPLPYQRESIPHAPRLNHRFPNPLPEKALIFTKNGPRSIVLITTNPLGNVK